jgi:tetratricopeptide (TPR) repeat protein/tRNA A-37 threonylcarbamoyl transferase component Bud32
MIGQTIAHYQITEKIGEGGMGVVYKASDLKLKRTVALKFLSPEMLQDESAHKRLIREARSAAALDHPYICSIHEVGESDGQDFIVMEYVDGQTLKDRLARGPLPLKEALQTAIEVAEALEEAHENGIVHRDLKPANIMLTSKGHAKVMDFGLVKLLVEHEGADGHDETLSLMTQPGVVAGTPAYMSPEQLLGGAIDGRSDIFSLGIVFYEMFGGQHPFRASTSIGTGDRILHDKPRPLVQINPEVPVQLEQLVESMLSKKPEDRCASMKGVLRDLRNLVRSGPFGHSFVHRILRWYQRRRLSVLSLAAVLLLVLLAASPTIWQSLKRRLRGADVPGSMYLAVLPFEAAEATAETTAFGRGLTETLNARLSRLTENHSLQVIPASEVRAQNVHRLEQARREFGVNLVLEGSLQQAAGMLRVRYWLVDTLTRRQLRADTITAPATDPFAVEDKVVASVLDSLEIELEPRERTLLTAHETRQPAAYDYYLRGRGYLQDYYKPESIESAITVFRRALEQDGRYALAHAGMGEAFWRMYELTQDAKYVDQAQAACAQAVAMDSGLSTGHTCLGIVYAGRGKYEQAVQEFQRAVLFEPTSDDAYRGLASAYGKLGRPAEAEKTYRRAIDLRPQYWAGYSWMGALYCSQGRYGDAAEMFSQVVKLAPDCYRGYSNLGGAYLLQGHYPEAIPLIERSLSLRPTGSAFSNLGTARFFQRQFAEAAQAYEEAAKLDEREWLLWGNLGDACYMAPGKRASASGAYRKAVALAEDRLRINPRDAAALGYLAYYYAMLDERAKARARAEQAVAAAPTDPELLFNVALAHNQLGEVDQALAWLEKSLAAGYSRSTIRDTPLIDNLRSDRRFQQLLQNR